MSFKVQWKIDGIFKADAAKVYKEIGNGSITPEEVLERARNEKSELHKCFDWDDTSAANKYRLIQAQKVIRMLVTIPDKKDDPPVRVLQISTEKSTYQPVEFFMRNEDEYTALLKRALAELEAFKQRYASLKELEEVFAAIDNIA